VGGVHHPKSMTTNYLSIFYTVPDRWQLHQSGSVHVSWKCDPDAIIDISEAGNLDLSGLSKTNLDDVNTYFDRQISTKSELITVVADNLYWSALAQQQPLQNNCWYNFIAAMTLKAACHTWRKIPPSKQSEELFERLVTPTLSISDLLTGFDPQYQPNLLVGLHAWTYKVVRYNSYAEIRANGDPYFGLSNLGIVSRSSYRTMRTALNGNIVTDRVESLISICKVFKSYLERSKVSVNKLELTDWQHIIAEMRAMSIEMSIDELRGWIDRVGSLIRSYSTLRIDSYDDSDQPISIRSLASECGNCGSSYPDPYIDESQQILGQLFIIIDLFVSNLADSNQQILILRHYHKLKQREIGERIAKDLSIRPWSEISQTDIERLIHNYGSKACKTLQKIYSELLEYIHTQVPHPDGGKSSKNSLAIDGVKQLLEEYFTRKKF
jgi:hypothetical protein